MCNYTKKYLLLPILSLLFFAHCDSYQKVLKSTDLELKYTKAKEYYNNEDYYKAQPLFEELISVYKGTKDIEDIYYYYAYCHYGQGSLLLASYHFKSFVKSYPKSKYAEECKYMYAYCYYNLSPNPNLDQTYTTKAIEAFQLFVNAYPTSGRVEECNEIIDKLRKKLAAKAYKNAELYYRLGHYKAASTAFMNLSKDYPNMVEREKIHLYILKSYYQLASKSIFEKKEERYELAIEAYYDFIDKFADSKFAREAENIYESSVNQLKKIKAK